jgi:serine/threonine protein kinase/formylglycine-generating enzyme required for sulfatase activity
VLQSILERYAAGDLSLAEAADEIRRIVAGGSAEASDAHAALRSARDAGTVDEPSYRYLTKTIERTAQRHPGTGDDAPDAGDTSTGETTVLTGTPGAGPRQAGDAPASSPDLDLNEGGDEASPETPDFDLRTESSAAGEGTGHDASSSATPGGDADEDAATAVATQPAGGDDESETMAATGPGDTSDASDHDASSGGPSTPSTGTGSSSSAEPPSWTPPGAEGSPELQGLGPGSVIKDRFVLEKVLGSGGMGKVYQARDQLKVEARDRNPYVAMKVLTEDFKEHPEAFIALQRESSRQQSLAHPNIATVYDFDRIGTSGTQVFITMELMEGYPLNTYLKKEVKPRGGLPPEEALPIIRQLGAALSYAHRRDIVHSDFKPGNCFLCNDGTVKVLDFGIARAVKHQGESGEEGEAGAEKTYFDPGQLGALTPAYASLEMLEGEAPDPRDDIYALACVSYELLTGHHPFGRKSAAQARAANLTPAPVKSLKRRQMRGLLRGLAFQRANRSPNVDTFVEQVEGRLNWHKNPYVIGGALAAAVAIASINPTLDHLEERRIQQMVSEVQTGHPEVTEETLAKLPELQPRARQTITEEARDTIQGYFEQRVRASVAPADGRYDFDAAETALSRARELYPDSQALADLEQYLASAREKRLNELNQQFMSALEDDRLLERQGTEQAPAVPTVLDNVERIAPDHELLTDPRIPHAYASAAQGAINTGDLDRGASYIETGEALTKGEDTLRNVRDRLTLARERRRHSERVEALRTRFEGRLDEIQNLDDLRAAQEAIIDLARLAPDAPVLSVLRDAARPIVAERVQGFGPDDREQASAFVETNRTLFEALGLHKPLIRAQVQTQAPDQRARKRQQMLRGAIDRLDAAVSEPTFDPAWRADVRQELGYIEALAGTEDTSLGERSRAAIARAFRERARTLQQEERYSQALAVLDHAAGLGLDQTALAETRAAIESDRTDLLREREQQAERARLESRKQSVIIQARAQDVERARRTLEAIRPKLDEDDPFLSVQVPEVLGQAYADVADEAFNANNDERALEMANAGLEIAPNQRDLQNARQAAKVELNVAELEGIFRQELSFDTARVSRMVNEIRAWAPSRYQRLEPEFIDLLAGRIEGVGEYDRREAESLATRASNVFPGSTRLAQLREEMAPDPWPEGAAARAALSAGRLNEAQKIVDEALAEMPQHPEVTNFQQDLQQRKQEAQAAFEAFEQALQADELDKAQDHLAEARSMWVDNRDYRDAQSKLSTRIAEQRRQQSQVLTRSAGVESLETSGQEIVEQDWQPIQSPRPCRRELAGHGPRARAVCFDLIHDQVRGPLMVVVPGNDGFDPFAISKYEISNEDYNKYCFLSGNCAVDQNASEDLPKTGLSRTEIEDYVAWLAERTGKSYRLPKRDEWVYAAQAGGDQPPRDFNCRATLGGSVLKGTGLVDVTTGHQNGWGLKNYVGNAQELVRANGDWLVRGGAYRDPHAKCSYELERTFNGNSNGITGLRVVLDDIRESD